MTITIHPDLETKLRAKHEEIESLAIEGLNSGDPFEPDAHYWEEQHRRLDERLKASSAR